MTSAAHLAGLNLGGAHATQKLPAHLVSPSASEAISDDDTIDLCSSSEDEWELQGTGPEPEDEDEVLDEGDQGWGVADVLNEAVPEISQHLLEADERSIHMSLSLGFLTAAQKVALGLNENLSLDFRLIFRSVHMGVGKVPLGEVTARLLVPPGPEQPDKLTITTSQASRWMLPGGLQASRQAQLFPGRRVIWQLATMLEKVLRDDWPHIAAGRFRQAVVWVRTLHRFMQERVTNLGNYCLICGQLQEIRGLKPVPCASPMCCHRHDELGFGADLHEVVDSPGVADLLITLAASASCDLTHRHSLFVGAPSDFVRNAGSNARRLPASDTLPARFLANVLPGQPAPEQAALLSWQTSVNGSIDFDMLNNVFGELPSVAEMRTAEDLEGFLQAGSFGRSAYRLVRWILSTNRGYLVELPPDKQIPEMRGQQFYLMTNSPEREAAFQKLKVTHGSFWKFHGSAFHNWHSILRTNLRNVSGTALMRVGQALGKGIYLASNSQTSRSYCPAMGMMTYAQSAVRGQGGCLALGLCEVAAKDTGADAIAVPDENAVALRYLFIYTSSDFPTVNAAQLQMGTRRLPV